MPEHDKKLTQRYLLHATQVGSARLIVKEGFKLVKGRTEFHFVEHHFNLRQHQYLKDSGGRQGVWLMLDTHKAMLQGMYFRLLPNDVVVTTGVRGWIPPDCVIGIWKDQNVRYDLEQFRSEQSLLVTIPAEGAHPRPMHREKPFTPADQPDTIRVPIDSDDNVTTAKASPKCAPKRPAPSDSSVFTPRSPNNDELDEPEPDRPPSRYHQNDVAWTAGAAPKQRRMNPAASSSQDTEIVYTANSEPLLVDQDPFVKAKPAARLTPNPASMSPGDLHRYIQEAVQREVENRMDVIRSTVGARIDATRTLTTAPSPSLLQPPPVFPGFLHCPQQEEVMPPCPPRSHVPDCQLAPCQEATEHCEEESEYIPKSLEECMLDAFSFEATFHPRAIPPYPTGKWVAATPAQRVVIDKRHKARVKRAQQPISAQKNVQWNALLRRAQRAAETGNVNFSRAVVVGLNEFFGEVCDKIRVIVWQGLTRMQRWCVAILRLYMVTSVLVQGWEFSAGDVASNNGIASATGTHRRASIPMVGRVALSFSLRRADRSGPTRAKWAFAIEKVVHLRAVPVVSLSRSLASPRGPPPGRTGMDNLRVSVRRNSQWGKFFVAWLACLWIPPPPTARRDSDKGTREQTTRLEWARTGTRVNGHVCFPPIRAGGGPPQEGAG